MMMNALLWLYNALICISSFGKVCAKSEDTEKEISRPNIVLIVADDMGWGDVGANWPETLDTPNLDKLAENGLRFTDFHVGTSVCTPSRAALLTGRLGLRTGVIINFEPESVGGLPTNETTIAEVLKAAGYSTAMFGKWHLGHNTGHHPLDKGFQHYLGVPYSIDMGCADTPAGNLPQCLPCAGGLRGDNYSFYDDAVECPYYNITLPLYSDKRIDHQPVGLDYLSTMYADFARHFIFSRKDKPYFLYGALSHIHVPLAHAPEFNNITGRGLFADTLYEMDWLVGQIVTAVEESPEGSDNTLIWFISDNGPWESKCSFAGSIGPYQGKWQRDESNGGGGGGSASKFSLWEGGHRVPSILSWPSKIKPGTVSDALTSSLDFLPTFAAMGEAELPTDRHFDGMNILDVILGLNDTAHKVLFHPNCNTGAPNGEIGAVRVDTHKVVYYTGGTPDCSNVTGPLQDLREHPLVFNLDEDPAESTPLKNDTEEYKEYVQLANDALKLLHDDIATDKITVANYSTDPDIKPCCDHTVDNCRCPWD